MRSRGDHQHQGVIRLHQVDIQSMSEVSKALEFYIGKNTPERKNFIIENLVYEV